MLDPEKGVPSLSFSFPFSCSTLSSSSPLSAVPLATIDQRPTGPTGLGAPAGEIKKLMGGVLWGRATCTWCRDLCLHHRDIVPLERQ